MQRELAVSVDWLWERIKEGEPLFFIELHHPGDVDLSVHKVRGALVANLDDVLRHLPELPHDRLVVICATVPGDEPALELALRLKEAGIEARALTGGVLEYLKAGLPAEERRAAREMTRNRGL
ncbi:rhodanese-like domain-containing protein [Geomonas edaphica]|uniref:rhodanese-like domain-containing protein n=1 Tax=Geomonas edaphica TaxID=2570226 RepID=UPI0010A91F15|nr:sulfurtransferase [Geomonas edaphica]